MRNQNIYPCDRILEVVKIFIAETQRDQKGTKLPNVNRGNTRRAKVRGMANFKMQACCTGLDGWMQFLLIFRTLNTIDLQALPVYYFRPMHACKRFVTASNTLALFMSLCKTARSAFSIFLPINMTLLGRNALATHFIREGIFESSNASFLISQHKRRLIRAQNQ